MSVIIVINVAFVLLGTLEREPQVLVAAAPTVEGVSVVLFTLEYALRLWTADLLYPASTPARARLRYVMSGMAIIDLLSILPFYLPAILPIDLRVLRLLRLVRLVRVFKLGRHSRAMATLGRVLGRAAPALVSAMSVIFLLVVVWSVLMYFFENPVQPDTFTSAFTGLWWAISTITTVGYGDIYPITVIGRIFGAIIELSGVALVAIPTGIVSAEYMKELDDADASPSDATTAVAQLAELRVMLEDGLLTRREFDTVKASILARLGPHPDTGQ